MGIVKQAYAHPVLLEDIIQFQLPDVLPSEFQQVNHKDLVRVDHLCRAAILSYKEDNDFKDSPRKRWTWREGSPEVKIMRMNSTHALRGRLSRRSEISPMDDWLCTVETTRSLVLELRRLSWLRGFLRLRHWFLLRAYHDYRCWLCIIAYLTDVCHFTPCRNEGARIGVGITWGYSLDNRPPPPQWRRGFNQVPDFPVRQIAPLGSPSVWHECWVHRPLTAFKRRPLSKRCLSLLPLHLAPVFGSVVSCTTAAVKLLLWGRAFPWEASLTTSNTPGCRMKDYACPRGGSLPAPMSGCCRCYNPSVCALPRVPIKSLVAVRIAKLWVFHSLLTTSDP